MADTAVQTRTGAAPGTASKPQALRRMAVAKRGFMRSSLRSSIQAGRSLMARYGLSCMWLRREAAIVTDVTRRMAMRS